jgi:aminopeptidase-like protein
MRCFAEELFPYHRAITGAGVRQTFDALQKRIPLSITAVPSGTDAYGWPVPKEWVIRDAYVKDSSGRRVIDYRASNLHIVSYSRPIFETMTWTQLRPHLHSLPDHPEWIPYRTTHFSDNWGFCLAHRDLERLSADGEACYQVCIDSELIDGELLFAECILPGRRDEEILISTHVCHPSLANDNVAALVISATLATQLRELAEREWTYRFLFTPATIGAIAWLHHNQSHIHRVRAGLVLSTLGDSGNLTYKQSRRGNSVIDRVVPEVLSRSGREFQIREFTPYGYDERQFCSPGFNLPMGCLMRTPHGEYPEYHTSADNLRLLSCESMLDSLYAIRSIVLSDGLLDGCDTEPARIAVASATVDTDPDSLTSSAQLVELTGADRLLNLHPRCEPPLGKFGLYHAYGQTADPVFQHAVLWVLNLSDGHHDLDSISRRSQIDVSIITVAAERLRQCGLLINVD